MAKATGDWRASLGPLGGLLRIDWAEAARVNRHVLAAPARPAAVPSVLPKGVTAAMGPGARLDWLVSRPIRAALGGRIVELYFRQLFDGGAPLYTNFTFGRFRFDATKDVLRWTPQGPAFVSLGTREALTRLYDGLFAGDDATMAGAMVALGLAKDPSPSHSRELVETLRRHLAGHSLRAVDFREVSLLSTAWRLSTAAGKHGARVAPDLPAVALLLVTMTQTLRALRTAIDVGSAYQRAKNG